MTDDCDITDRHGDRAYALALFLSISSGGNTYAVTSYGATGNGTTDDTAAINAALTAAPAGSTVLFPPGTYSVSSTNHNMIIVTKKNITLLGASRDASIIRVKNSNGDYNTVISDGVNSGTFLDLSGLRVQNLTIDQNSANNTMADVSLATGPLFHGDGRYAIRVFKGFDVTFENVHFANTDCVNTVAGQGPAGSVKRFKVRNCLFDNVGNGTIHDHSSIYFSGDGLEVRGCEFVAGGHAAATAIETHGPNQIITDNTVRGYGCGINLTGVSTVTSTNLTFTNNEMIGVACGVHLWAYNQTGLTGYAVDGVIIANNLIDVDVDGWQVTPALPHTGILLDNASTALCRNVKMNDNVITFRSFVSTPNIVDQISCGITWWRSVTVASGGGLATEEVGIEACRNIITNSLGPGIYIEANIPLKRIRILDNVILNPGQGTALSQARSGVRLGAASAAGEDFLVARNKTIDNLGTHILDAGVNSQLWVAAMTDGRMTDNEVRAADGTNVVVHRGHTSLAWYSRQAMPVFIANPGFWKAGSSIVDMSTGATYTQTATPSGSTWSSFSPQGLRGNRFNVGNYYTAPDVRSAATPVIMTQNLVYYTPFYVTETATFDRIGVTVTTNQASTTIRLGIYADNGHGAPTGAPILDAGTVDSATAAASVEATISQQLTPGLYWIASVSQGGTTQPTVSQTTIPTPQVGAGSLASGIIGRAAYSQSGVSGALTTYSGAGAVAFAPIVALRAITIP